MAHRSPVIIKHNKAHAVKCDSIRGENGTQKEAEKKRNKRAYAERYSEYSIRDVWLYR